MKPKSHLFIVLILLLLLSACNGKGDPVPPPTPDSPNSNPVSLDPLEDGIIVAATFPDSPPFEFKNQNGELVGFDIDLMRAIVEAEGLQVKFVETGFGGIFGKLAAGEFEAVISSATISDEEEHGLADFSQPYFNAGLGIVVGRSSAITGTTSLNGLSVGVQIGSSGEVWLKENTTATPKIYDQVSQALEALAGGSVPAVVHDAPVVLQFIKDNPRLDIKVLPPLVSEEYYGVAIAKGKPELLERINNGLAKVRASGEYDEIYTKWFGQTTGIDSGGTTAEENILIVYGSEKEDWLEPLVVEYNAANYTTSQGNEITVEAMPMGSLESAEAILAGTLKATVWSPASSLYVPLASQTWLETNGTPLYEGETPSLVRSPVVIAMWQPMAESLGWPAQPISWATIRGLSGQDWSEYGHPEWGTFKFGHTHPEHSNSGITALLSEVYAGAGKTTGLTTSDLERQEVRSFLVQIERSIIDYGRSTGFYARRMLDCEIGGPTYLSAAVLYENLVAAQKGSCPGQPPLVAIYPEDGTFWSDHPYIVLNVPWVTSGQKEAAQDFVAFLLAPPQQQRALDFGFRPVDSGIPLSAPLIPENGVDPDQPRLVLEVPLAEVIAGSQSLWREAKKAADVVVVMDVSGSMVYDDKIGQAKAALVDFVNILGNRDRLQIMTFGDEIRTLTSLSELGEKRTATRDLVTAIELEGPTPLYDATIAAYNELKANGDPEHIRAIVVLTDGFDESTPGNPGSQSTREQMLDTIQIRSEGGNAIKLFTIAYGSGADREVLQQMSNITGGEQFDADTVTIFQVYENISLFF